MSLSLPKLMAVPLFVAMGAISTAITGAVLFPDGEAPFLTGLLVGGTIVLPPVMGVISARSLRHQLSVTIAIAALSFPMGLNLFLQLTSSGHSLWTGFAVGLPIGVPLAVGTALAHLRALEWAARGVGFGFRWRVVLLYAGYGCLALIFPTLHFAFKELNFFPSVHVLLWGGGMTLMLSQALAMTSVAGIAHRSRPM